MINIRPNYTRQFVVKFSTPNNTFIYHSHPANYLSDMERQFSPPRHIWDDNFPGSMGFVTTIYHKVARRSRRKPARWLDIMGDYSATSTTVRVVDSTARIEPVESTPTDEMIARYTAYVDALAEAYGGTVR